MKNYYSPFKRFFVIEFYFYIFQPQIYTPNIILLRRRHNEEIEIELNFILFQWFITKYDVYIIFVLHVFL